MELHLPIVERLLWRCRDAVLSKPASDISQVDGPIAVAGLFRAASGIGQSARACADGLENAGVDVHRVDLSAAFGQEDLPPDPRLSKRPNPGGTLIVSFNGPEFERALFLLGNWRGSGRRVIGMWVWEMPVAPRDWRAATRWLSEIWVPSRFSYEALRPLTDKPMKIVPYYVPAPSATPSRLLESPFTIITLADGKSSFARKNLLAAIAAFRTANFTKPAQLIVKTRNLESAPLHKVALDFACSEDPRIHVVDGSLSHSEVMGMLNQTDVLLSLHRSEGFGLTIAEAMLRGKAVVATNWSGNTDFMDKTCAIPVPFQLVPVDDSFGVYRALPGAVWAEPDVGYAAHALERLSSNPELCKILGNAAQARVAKLTTGQVYLEALSTGL